METFFLTFGQRYRDESHPADDRVHADGWVEVHAPNADAARQLITDTFGPAWSLAYRAEEFDERARSFFPLGCLFELTGDPDAVPTEECSFCGGEGVIGGLIVDSGPARDEPCGACCGKGRVAA